MSTLVWFVGFALMLISFTFLFGQGEQVDQPRISVDPWWPAPDDDPR